MPQASSAFAFGRVGRFGLGSFSSRIVARCPYGIRRAPRICPIAISSWRKCREFPRPLVCAAVIAGRGQRNVLWFTFAAIVGIALLIKVGNWYQIHHPRTIGAKQRARQHHSLSRGKVAFALFILIPLIFFQIHLSHELDELLHVLLDPKVSGFGGERPVTFVPFSFCGCCRNAQWRTNG